MGQLLGLVGLFIILSIYTQIRFHVDHVDFSTTDSLMIFLASVLAGLLIGVSNYRTMQDPKPPTRRVPKKEWPVFAAVEGFALAIGVAWATFWLWLPLVAVVGRLIRELFSLPPVSDIGFWCILVPVPLVLGVWAFVARYDQQIEVFETALPPELRLAVDLQRRAEAFRDRAQALEQAMEEATAISEQVRRGIELEQQQLAELHEQYLRQARLNELTPEQATAVAELLGRQQARSARRALSSNIVVGFVFYALGVVTPALISSDTLGEHLRQWLPF